MGQGSCRKSDLAREGVVRGPEKNSMRRNFKGRLSEGDADATPADRTDGRFSDSMLVGSTC